MSQEADDPLRHKQLPERTCRYDHGPLVADSGIWRMDQVVVNPDRTIKNNDVSFLFRLYVCRKCGYTELIDEGD